MHFTVTAKEPASFRRLARLAVAVASASVLTGCTGLVNSFAFHPERQPETLGALSHPRVQEFFFPSLDGTRLQAFFVPRPQSNRVVLFLHGNAGNALQRLPDALTLSDTNTNVFLLSYRGYGRSDGSPNERGVYQDARAALQYLEDELGFSERSTFILGRSLGSAVAVEIAQDKPFAGVILVTPLSSGKDMARHAGLGWLSWSIGNPFDSVEKIANVRSPPLFIHGNADEVIPLQFGQKLFEACASSKKTLKIVDGAGHNNLIPLAGQRYWNWIREFLDSVERPRQE